MLLSSFRPVLVAASVLVAGATARGQSAAVPPSLFVPRVRVAIQVDSADTARFEARGFELRVNAATGATAPAEVELVKEAGASTGELIRLGASGERAPWATLEVLDSLGKPMTTIGLAGVVVVSDRITLSAARTSLEEQRISQQEALSSLTADYQDAQRQLAMLEALSKSRVATRQDLAHARDRASDLQRRIDLLEQRQRLLATQIAAHGPLEETMVLHFDRLDIDGGPAGGHATIDLASHTLASKRAPKS